jgi:hypothetical protein
MQLSKQKLHGLLLFGTAEGHAGRLQTVVECGLCKQAAHTHINTIVSGQARA